MTIPSGTPDESEMLDALSRFWSFRVLRRTLSWDELTGTLQRLDASSCYYVLMDEFQSVFGSPVLLNAAKKVFRNLSSKPAVSYVAVGTFELKDLGEDETMESPFNKVMYASMPPFDFKEMGRLFDLYKEHCNPVGMPLRP
ncbi:hypothetical protein BGX31_010408 [Mortierella sp. GBA43]|nr:hypothetical protein BGX31_010408 [Mortierella sp. GBA43]